MKKAYYNIIFQDDDILIVDKYAGVYSIDPRHNTKDPILYSLLTLEFGPVFIVHRLDKDTSGLILFARNQESHKNLSEQFNNNEIEKNYYAFVDGTLNEEEAILIDAPIFINPQNNKVRIDKKGKPSRTKIRVIENYRKFSMLEARLLTGRTHQIRVHLEYIGNPLIVDKMYGQREAFYLSEIKRKYKFSTLNEESPLIDRQTLHAHQLIFKHPITNEKMQFNSDLPKDLKALRHQLQKTNTN